MAVEIDPTDAELCQRCRGGDREAADILTRRHRPAVCKIVANARPPASLRDDLIQEGMLALLRASRGWNPDAGAKFITYAWWAVSNTVVRALKVHARTINHERQPTENDEEGTVADAVRESPEALVRAIARLAPTQRDLLRLYYGIEGEPMRVGLLAERFGLTQFQVSRMIADAIDRL